MMKIVRDNTEIELTEQDVFDCYRAWRTKQDYIRLKESIAHNTYLMKLFMAKTNVNEDGLIYLALKELEQYYRRNEWKDLDEVLFGIMMENVVEGYKHEQV